MKEMRLAGIATIEAANRFLEIRFLPEWEQRFTVIPRIPAMRIDSWGANIVWKKS